MKKKLLKNNIRNLRFFKSKLIGILLVVLIFLTQNLMAQDAVNQQIQFTDFIKKVEKNEKVQQYFSTKENVNVKFTSRDVTTLNNFLKTNSKVFGKTLIKDENTLSEYILIDFNVMYSANTILVLLKEFKENEIVSEKTININY